MGKFDNLVRLMEGTLGAEYHTKVVYVKAYLSRGVVEVKSLDIFKELASAFGASDKIRDGKFDHDGWTYELNLVSEE